MRRMRDLPWHYYFLAVLAVGAAFGIQTLMRKYYPGSGGRDYAMTLKPSAFRNDSGVGAVKEKPGARQPASKESYFDRDSVALKPSKTREPVHGKDTYAASEDDEAPIAAHVENVEHKIEAPSAKQDRHAASTPDEPAFTTTASTAGGCEQIEFRGEGPDHTQVSKEEWSLVMKVFHDVKDDLLTWLNHRRHELPVKTVAIMEAQIKDLRIQRPPSGDEPDLAWRGIASWTFDPASGPLVRVGGGFVKMLTKQPTRGRFELARMVAQSWAPCELQRAEAGAPWDPLLKCLGVREEQACAAGSYSEGGWAVSTVMARAVVDPGCAVPALSDPAAIGCVKKVPLPLSVADGRFEVQGWQEARR